jgi:predicted nucleic acid-binding protein
VKLWLVDTGPLVAFLDARDPAHAEVADRFSRFTGRLATTSAVLTEAMHFVAASRSGPALLAEFVAVTAMRVHDLSSATDLRAAAELMAKYADTPMDFADATLILLADRLNVFDLATLDRRGFAVYRALRGRKPFRLVLDD